jgi:hypothetical protein
MKRRDTRFVIRRRRKEIVCLCVYLDAADTDDYERFLIATSMI